MTSVPISDSFPLNPAYDPLVIRYEPSTPIDFNGQPPLSGPTRENDNTIVTYAGQTNNGVFFFSKNRYFNVRQLVIDPGDATSWELSLHHDFLRDRTNNTTIITNSALAGAGLQRVTLDFTLLPSDALILTTTGTTATPPFAEMYAQPITLDRRIR